MDYPIRGRCPLSISCGISASAECAVCVRVHMPSTRMPGAHVPCAHRAKWRLFGEQNLRGQNLTLSVNVVGDFDLECECGVKTFELASI